MAKLCPFFVMFPNQPTQEFDCIGEKCAWWVEGDPETGVSGCAILILGWGVKRQARRE